MKKSPVSPSFLKQKAKQLKKQKSISQSKALDEVSKAFGYENWRHYLNFSNINKFSVAISPTVTRRNAPTVPTRTSGSFQNLFKDIYDLLDKPEKQAHVGLVSIIKNDKDPYRRKLAFENLVNNFDIDFSEVITLIQALPTNFQEMIWPYLDLDDEVESALFDFYMEDGQSQYDEFSTHSIAEGLYLGDVSYTLTNNKKIKVVGNFELSVDLQYGSDGDLARGDGTSLSHSFSGEFEMEINSDRSISILNAQIDPHSF